MTSTRRREGGVSATRLVDFLNHTKGTAFRHTADQLDMNPALTSASGALSDATVQGTLQKIGTFLGNAGQGFISIGEGYDVVAADFNVGTGSVPSLSSAFTQAFAHPRLANGGVILVKAGTYYLTSTVSVPAGIVIMGELGGTIINGLTVEQPMFIIKRAIDRPKLSSAGLLSVDPVDKTQIFNIVLTDGYVDKSYTPLMTTVPMIRCETGSYFTCDQVTFIGKMGTLGAGPTYGRTKTLYAIDTTIVGAEETTINLEKCVFDGLNSIIKFNPATFNDKLKINNCKARVFGTELSSDSNNQSKNCFVLVTGQCTVNITNNLLNPGILDGISAQSYISALTTTTASGVIFTINGNTGSINSFVGAEKTLVTDNGTGNYFVLSQSANVWNSQFFSNQWFIAIGDGVNSVGDITGTNSLDIALSLFANTGSQNSIYVNYGLYTYTYAFDLSSTVSIIGKHDSMGNRPRITLNVGSSSIDYLGNKFITVGQNLEHLEFVSTGSHQSIYVMRNLLNGQIFINDCLFTDTTLLIEKMTTDETFVDINNCIFSTTSGLFNNNLQLLAPPTKSTTIRNCLFSGSDYAIAIGAFSGIGYNNGSVGDFRSVNIENVSFELDTAVTIKQNSPLGTNRYVYINATFSKIVFDNVQMESTSSQIDGAILNNFTRWIELIGYDINIHRCNLSGIGQLTSSGTTLIPTLFVTPTEKFTCHKSMIFGNLPLQISGTTAFIGAIGPTDGISIKDCRLLTLPDNAVSTTVLDIDVSLGTLTSISGIGTLPIIDIAGNTFSNNDNTTASSIVPHMFNNVNVCGCVQIFAHGFDVHFDNNNIVAINMVDGVKTNVATLVVDAWTAVSGTNGSVYSSVRISGNRIYAGNNYSSGAGTDISSTLWVNCSYLNISNNNLTMINAFAPTNNVCVLYIKNVPTSNGTISGSLNSAIISGNSFNRASNSATGALFGGYVIIDSASGRGSMVGNEFDSLTYNGTSTGLVNNSGIKWNISRNKNQTSTIQLGFSNCQTSISNDSTIVYLDEDALGTLSSIKTTGLAIRPSNAQLTYQYGDNPSGTTYFDSFWSVSGILPIDTKISSATCTYASGTGVFSVTGTLILNISSQNASVPDTGSVSDVADLTSITSGTLTATPVNPENFNVTTDNPIINLHLEAKSANAENITFGLITLTYYW